MELDACQLEKMMKFWLPKELIKEIKEKLLKSIDWDGAFMLKKSKNLNPMVINSDFRTTSYDSN